MCQVIKKYVELGITVRKMCRACYNNQEKCVELVITLVIRAYYCRAYYGSPYLNMSTIEVVV